jgi:hypothetical protein
MAKIGAGAGKQSRRAMGLKVRKNNHYCPTAPIFPLSKIKLYAKRTDIRAQ